MDVKPLGNRVLVKPMEAEEKTSSGIYIPDSAKEKPQKGKVVAAGDGKLLDSGERAPMEVSEGDEVIYGKYSGSDFAFEGEEYMIMKEDDIMAII